MRLMRAMVGVVAAISAAGAAAAANPPFNPQPWLADFAAMKTAMAQYYANLESRLAAAGIAPARLDKAVTSALEGSGSDIEAYDTLRRFLDVFDDPHLKFDFKPRPAIDVGMVASGDPPAAAGSCAEAGYEERKTAFAPRIAALPGWRELGAGAFPYGIAGSIGVVRIASFSESHYAAVCDRVFKPGLDERALQMATRAELQTELVAAIAALEAAGAQTLLIDLTGNGGGTEWDREAATLFTARAMTRGEARIADAPCDRSTIWTGEKPCEVFREPGEDVHLQGAGNWTGPVAILADHRTASAAEEFIGWLVDNKVASLIGEKTAGAGCGYVDGGHPVALEAAPITLAMPNCARFTAAGVNEIEGWTPGKPLPFPDAGGEKQWGEALARLLGA